MILVPRQPSQCCYEASYWSLESGACFVPGESLRTPPPHESVRPTSPLPLLVGLPPLPSQLATLCQALSDAFQTEKQRSPLGSGPHVTLDYTQDSDSFARLDATVRHLLRRYMAECSSDWHQFMAFNPHHYVRHLLDATEDFELMLICWQPGQKSCVHNHAQSHCWLSCLMGEVEERQYALPEAQLPTTTPGAVTSPCPPLKLVDVLTVATGATAYINDHLGLHSVGCDSSTPEPGAVTLHLYAPPIRKVRLYEPDEDRVTTRVPGFFSVRGNRSAHTARHPADTQSTPTDAWGDILLFDGAGI